MSCNKVKDFQWDFKNFIFRNRVLGISKGIEEIGGMQWQLFGCLTLGWIIIYFIIRKGLHQSGKVKINLVIIFI